VAVANSALEVVASKVESLRALLLELGVAPTKRFRSVYVVDTSALVAEPDLLTKFGDDELVVVSKRVIEELDDKKRDETLRPAVARATRLLREFPRVRIEFCDGDLSLLSPDYRNKGDNHILSVAVKFKGQQPTLLTNDNLLALKATAEGIQTMDSRRFSQRTPPAATSRMTSRPAPRDRAMTIDGNNVKPSRRKS
jgi:predicted ribonuclease YlaK